LETKEKYKKGSSSMSESINKWMRGRRAMWVSAKESMMEGNLTMLSLKKSGRELRGTIARTTTDRRKIDGVFEVVRLKMARISLRFAMAISDFRDDFSLRMRQLIIDERGDVPGWVLVVLMTTGLVTGIWAVAAPRIESLLRGSLDSMNSVR